MATKKDIIKNWLDTNPGTEFSSGALAKTLNMSLPTLLNYIKDHPELVQKTGHGKYRVAGASATIATPTPIVTTTNLSGFDIDDTISNVGTQDDDQQETKIRTYEW